MSSSRHAQGPGYSGGTGGGGMGGGMGGGTGAMLAAGGAGVLGGLLSLGRMLLTSLASVARFPACGCLTDSRKHQHVYPMILIGIPLW